MPLRENPQAEITPCLEPRKRISGLIVGAAKGIVTGNLTGNQLWKCYTAGAIGGATIGAYTPV